MKEKPLKIFFSGIGGSGVSALASFMADRGHVVAGSDRLFDREPLNPLSDTLKAKGITLVPQDGTGIDRSFDLAVFSTAVESDRPEVVKAQELEIPIKTRPEFLTELTSDFSAIAVAGTSGKSTAAGLLTFLMQRLGMKPNYIGGGRVKQLKTDSHPGNALTGNSDYLIIEACESDGTIVNYRPEHSLILNLELDHHPIEKTSLMFHTLMKQTAEKIIVNADDKGLMEIAPEDAITFSIHNPSKYRAEDIDYEAFITHFSLSGTHFSIAQPGEYNLSNALACIAFLAEKGRSLKDIANVIPEFTGIERRFDVHLNDGNTLVIDDYAHNPHKISSLMKTVNGIRGSICYIFQPHGFAPTRMMKKEYIETFVKHLRDSDHLILLPIYYAGGTADKDISSDTLAEGIAEARRSVEVVVGRGEIFKRVHEYKSYVVFGARDDSLSDLARAIADAIRERK